MSAGETGFRFELDPFSGGLARVIDLGPYSLADTIDVANSNDHNDPIQWRWAA